MKHRIFFFLLIFIITSALACNLPWIGRLDTPLPLEIDIIPEPVVIPDVSGDETPLDEPIPQPTGETAQDMEACGADMAKMMAFSVEFCYPEAYSNGFTQTMIPENPPDDETPIWGVTPDAIEIILTGYPVENEYHDPQIMIYPVADFVALEPSIQTRIDDLRALLASQDPQPATIPFVPVFNAAQMMQANVSYLNFRNGKGVRFITQYGQAALPINNDSAFYAFIGLTDDGVYLISAIMPVTHPLFYADILTEPTEGWEAFTENYDTYIATMELTLAAQPQEAFFPHLSPLDAMMRSFLIPSGAIP